ncbi:molybdopterin-dependent oxidoreductase [Planctomyces sp. SH-PL62]|uniref:molybdopterin-dependent oxidoreductase n=1 Tax=Planctomyces sp. SH-PL62 TaxID=1636152 RepID=UPI00078EE4BC|nr:molybdopterin-dependent oxidoreductase [Planctomyces sp. SH-PL62]AMV39573.1 NADH-quinone oxidoreductase chain 3 [Planctomyces sp. SH-PL62]
MATILINGAEYPIPEGEKLNAIQMAKRVGVEIPYYCWHPSLSVVANCRMCEVEVGAKDPKTGEVKMMPKLVPGCQTPAKDGTVLVTDSPKVQEHQRMIMEMLLLNHPLDCPVCDQAGECGLQDYSYHHGQSTHRFLEERIVNPRKDVSDLIQLNQDRCIMCTRCVRFTREITQTAELQVTRRGSHAEIATFPGVTLDDNPLAGNVVDLCPVGALLDKDFLHKQRVWFLSKHDSVCTRCSTGCNISVEENKGKVWRVKPRNNPHVNDYWICDEGRYGYKNDAAPEDLLEANYALKGGDHVAVAIDEAVKLVDRGLKQAVVDGRRIAGVLSPFLTVEEAYLMARYLKGVAADAVLAVGPVTIRGEDQTFTPGKTEGRSGDTTFLVPRPFTIHAEKAPNVRGVRAVLEHVQGSVVEYDDILKKVEAGEVGALYVASGSPEEWIDEATASAVRDKVGFVVVQDSRISALAHKADVVLAGGTYAEKAGSYVNADGRIQYAEASLPPRDGSLPDLDLFAILLDRPGGPARSGDVLAELAETAPTFAAAKGGALPEYGAPLDPSAPREDGPPPFVDAWYAPMGAAKSR